MSRIKFHCEACGRELVTVKTGREQYDPYTGKLSKVEYSDMCPRLCGLWLLRFWDWRPHSERCYWQEV